MQTLQILLMWDFFLLLFHWVGHEYLYLVHSSLKAYAPPPTPTPRWSLITYGPERAPGLAPNAVNYPYTTSHFIVDL